MKYRLICLFITILNSSTPKAQFLTEEINHPHILSAQFTPEGFELGYPILSLNSENALLLQFDLMNDKEQPSLAYRLIHCDTKWQKSKISTRDYLENPFNEFYVNEYDLSLSTKRNYTHYTAKIKAEQLKLSGNYIVQLFAEDSSEEIWLQKRFIITENQTNIIGKISMATDLQHHKTHQRVQFEVGYDKNTISYPRTHIKAAIVQNFRWSTAQLLSPLFVGNEWLKFNYIDKKGLFAGNYEFPFFDTSNIAQKTHSIHSIEEDEEGETHCYLYLNEMAANNYFYLKDMNGNFAIKADNTFDSNTEADYVWTHFSLTGGKQQNPVYVVGRFNQWKTSEDHELFYDKDLGLYQVGLLLKQGVYNYTFTTLDEQGNDVNLLGNYSETENDYYIFIYYKDDRLQTDRIIGWKRLNSSEE